MIKGKALQTLLEEIDSYCSSHSIHSLALPFIPNISPYCGKFLRELVEKNNLKNILEIGTAVGYSAIWMASGIKGKVITIEIDKGMIEKARENFAKAAAENLVELIEGDANKILPKLKNKKFDLIFLDALKEDYLPQFKLCNPMLRKGGYLTAHNVFSFKQALKPFVEYICSLENFETKLIEKADLLVAKKLV